MTADQIATIRHLRGCNIPWPIVAKQLRASVAECRQAIGLPGEYPATQRRAMPWDKSQQTLPFENEKSPISGD